MDELSIALLPGDGIGREVVPAAADVLRAVADLHGGLKLSFEEFPWSCQFYGETGEMMPPSAIQTLSNFEAILLGAVGSPEVPDHVSLWGMLIPIRREFEEYVNLRPVVPVPGIESNLKDQVTAGVDLVVIRENSEGEYSDMGGRIHTGTPYATAVQVDYFSQMAIERIVRYAFELAIHRKRHVTVATKSNGIRHSMPFWDEVARSVATDYSDVACDFVLIDALVAYFVTKPSDFDVVVASNLYGDILTDLGGAMMGSIGMAAAANLNPERRFPSTFEPVHGSAPDIAGRGIANPIGQIWSVKLLLDFFGMEELAGHLMSAIGTTLVAGLKTPDLGGSSSTREVTQAIVDRLYAGASG